MDKPIAWIKARELTYMKAVVEHGATEWKTNLGLKPEDGDVPLYTTPPQRGFIGLTDEEYTTIMQQADHDAAKTGSVFQNLRYAIEAKLKEKNA